MGDLLDDRAATDLVAMLARVAWALRTMSPGKLAAQLPGPTASRADAGRLLARTLAVAAQGIERAGDPEPPAWRSVPEVGDLVVGDQVNVLAHDLRPALAEVADASAGVSGAGSVASITVWTPQGRAPLADVLRDLAATAEEVQRLL
ncbi:MAG: hypothetical protein ACRDV3_07040 [Acidothermaceae bacterium]